MSTDEQKIARIEKKIANLEKKISAGQKRFDKLLKWFTRFDDLDEREERKLDRVEAAFEKLKSRKSALYIEMSKIGVIELPLIEATTPMEKEFGKSLYFSADCFQGDFETSIKNWTQDGGIALNSVQSYMNSEKSSAGLSIGDVLKVVAIIFPPTSVLATAVEVGSIIHTGLEAALKSRSKKPSLSEIHSSWVEALEAPNKQDMLDEAFEKFVKQWRIDNKIPKDVEKTRAKVFGPDCRNYARDNLPGSNDVQKAFLAQILLTVEDSGDFDDEAGQAELYMTMPTKGVFVISSGMLDDVSEKLMNAISTVFKGARVIDLPVKISIIIEYVSGTNIAEFRRDSRTPGNTDFRQIDGKKEIYEAFKKKEAYLKPKVSDITYDMSG